MATPEPPAAHGQPLRELADAELVRRVADRREEALAELYDRHAAMLLGLARRILGDGREAEEVLQEVFVQVWAQAGHYDARRASPSTWLVLLTRSRAIDRLRSRQVRERTAAAAGAEAPRHASHDGPQAVLYEERRERVRSALGELPPEQREVLELAFYEGLTQREIAQRRHLPLGTVKTRTLLAMKKLRLALRDEVRNLL